MKQTAMQELWEWIDANCHEESFNINDAREMSLSLEKEQLKEAIMYALDEDGHTGEWKIKFANDYIKSLNSK